MDLLNIIIFVGAGTLAGFVIAHLVNKKTIAKAATNEALLHSEKEKTAQLNTILTSAKAKEEQLQERLSLTTSQKVKVETMYKNLLEKYQQQKQDWEQVDQRFVHAFKNMANEIMEDKSQRFAAQNQKNLDGLLSPLREKIDKFEKRVEQSSKENLSYHTALHAELNHLKSLNLQITKEAENLTKALKGDNKQQGNWGELQLEMILEKVGLQKDVHFFKEKNLKSGHQNLRPDFIIKLPEQKHLIIDSKVSLTAFAKYNDTEDEKLQQKSLKEHLQSIRQHINGLSERNYQQLYQIAQPDFILMFIANEPALTLALHHDEKIYENALEKNIVLVTASTLLATLRTVSYIWKQEIQQQNAKEIARQAGALYDKFVGFSDDMLKIGNAVQQTQNHYDQAMKKLTNGQGNLVRRAEHLKKMGAAASKQIDERLDNDTLS